MTVLQRIGLLRATGCVHMTLIDPDKQAPADAGRIAASAARAGSDAIMIGGSSQMTRAVVEQTVREIKAAAPLPTILFPSGARAVAPSADAIFFMSLLNSRAPQFLMREQKDAAPFLKQAGIQTIPMGYLIIEPGMRVGEVGQADLIRRDDPQEALRYALAAEAFGMAIVYLEAGSGAPEPVPIAMVAAVRAALSILLCVGGGIRTPQQAAALAAAGADIIVTGTLVEDAVNVEEALQPLIAAIKNGCYSSALGRGKSGDTRP
jgi:phosphoglycerol geranylgeranyltransferase